MLEISCGRGGGLCHLIGLLLAESHAIGLDFSINAIRYCTHHYTDHPNVAFVCGHALRLPFGDMSFDVVVNVEASHAYRDDAAFLQEVSRILARGGKFLYADYRRRYNVPALERLARDTASPGPSTISPPTWWQHVNWTPGEDKLSSAPPCPGTIAFSQTSGSSVRGGPGNCELRAFPRRGPDVLHDLSDAAAMMYAPCGTTTALRLCHCGACSGAGSSGGAECLKRVHDQPVEASAMAVALRPSVVSQK